MARPLYPADTGGRIRSSKLFERLSQRHEMTVACFTTKEDRREHLDMMRACCSTLETVPWSEVPKFTPRFYGELAACLFSPLPYTVWKYRSAPMQRRVAQLLKSGHYDLLLCDFLQPAINCVDITFGPRILFQHNVEAMIGDRQTQHEVNPLARLYLRQDALKLRRFERRATHAFDRCIMVSEEDCRVMQSAYGAVNTSSIPTGVDIEFFAPPEVEPRTGEIAFIGSMDWLPNQDAVEYFVAQVLPLIRRSVPDVTFVVVGRNPSASIRALANDRSVRVTGTVDDVRPHVARAQVCVVPLRVGGGTRIKIFEAMAMNRAVVSTTVGAEGLPVTHGENIGLADSPAAFAAEVVRLLQDRAARERMADAGYRLVRQGFSWDAAADRFSEICVEVVRQGGPGTRPHETETVIKGSGSR